MARLPRDAHHLRAVAGADLAAVFVPGDVPDVMQAVLNPPVAAHEVGRLLPGGVYRGQRGDCVRGLGAAFGLTAAAHGPGTGDPDGLLRVREQQALSAGAGRVGYCGLLQRSGLSPSVSAVSAL